MKNLLYSFFFILIFSSSSFAISYSYDWIDMPIREVALEVSRITGTPISISGPDSRLTMRVIDSSDAEIFSIFCDACRSLGLTAQKTDWGLLVSPSAGVDLGSGWAVYPLKFSNAQSIAEPLKTSIGLGVSVYPVGSGLIYVTGSASQVRDVGSVIRSLDQPALSDVDRLPVRYLRVSIAAAAIRDANLGVSVIPDYWGRSLVVSGDFSARSRARTILSAIDSPSDALIHRVFLPTRLGSADLASSLSRLYDGLDFTTPGNSTLMISGPSSLVEQCMATASELDGSGSQVQVECCIASLSDTAFHELGVRLSALFSQSSVNLNAAGYDSLLTAGPGLLVDLVSGKFSASVGARDASDNGRILSQPSLSVLSGHSASISVGSNVPFVSSSTKNNDGSTTVSVERHDVGISLQIKPIIDGDFVLLELSQEVSSIADRKSSAVDLVTDKRSISSVVKAADGQTVFLGGVRSSESSSTVERVPVIGWVPLIGNLFSYKSSTKSDGNLVISIRPIIVRSK